MSVLLKKPFLTGLVVFLLTIFWGSLGFTALYKHLPAFMEWTLCLLSPFAFTAGMAQVRMKSFCFYLFLCVYVPMHRHAVTSEVRGHHDRCQFSPSTTGVVGIKLSPFYQLNCPCCPTYYLGTQYSKHIPSMIYAICTKH